MRGWCVLSPLSFGFFGLFVYFLYASGPLPAFLSLLSSCILWGIALFCLYIVHLIKKKKKLIEKISWYVVIKSVPSLSLGCWIVTFSKTHRNSTRNRFYPIVSIYNCVKFPELFSPKNMLWCTKILCSLLSLPMVFGNSLKFFCFIVKALEPVNRAWYFS